jgi:hypothetical protein
MEGKRILETLERIPGPEDHPDADAVIIADRRRFVLHEDGRIEEHRYIFKRVLRDYDRDKASDVPILFDQERQEVVLLGARSIMRDGTIVESPEYAVNQITPAKLAKAPHLTRFQQRVISLVGVETGGYTELEFKIVDREPWQPQLSGNIPLCGRAPALSRDIVIDVPAERELTYLVTGVKEEETPPLVEQEDGRKRATFRFSELPLWDLDGRHPLAEADCPRLIFSEKRTWDELAAQLGERVAEGAVLDDVLERRVKKLLEDMECPVQSTFRLQQFVQDAVATIDFPPRIDHFATRPAHAILRSGYGNPFEKAILLCTLLRVSGQPAEVALACPLPLFPKGELHLGLFDSVWVWTPELNLFMRPDKPLHEARRVHLEGHVLLVSGSGVNRHCFTDPGRPGGNRFDARVKVKIEKDGAAEGSVDATVAGICNPYFKLYREDAEKVTGWVKGLVGKLCPGAELDTHHFRLFSPDHSTLNAKFKVKSLPRDPDHRYMYTIPAATDGLADFSISPALTERHSTFALPGTLLLTLKIEIELPREWELSRRPGDSESTGDVCELERRIDVETEEGNGPTKLKITGRFRIREKYVPPESYPELRELLLLDQREQNRILFFVER